MDTLKGKWIEVHGYKHDGRMHRIWDAVFVVEEKDDYVVVASNRTKVIEHDFRVWHTKEPAIMIYFKNSWFNVIAMLKDVGITYYVNLASPFVIDRGVVKYIDYDLDMKLFPDNQIKIIDVREYAYHRRKYGYSDEIDKILRYNLKSIKEIMTLREFPFDDKKIKEFYDEFLKNTSRGELNENKSKDQK
ncbi:MAG: DUF402 domain-containing protein [Bacilli bacterium]|jgi:uncharacterized protein